MDPVTHGIAGALLGKGFFSKRQEKVAIFAATLGAVFPDIDTFYETYAQIAHHDPLAIVKYHRAITHSFVGLPFFAALLAALTPPVLNLLKRRYPRLHDWEAPPFWLLTIIYGVGIASHILLDVMTSFGTRMWYPISTRRFAWDLLFIIDFAFTTIMLAPQVTAWIYRDPAKSRGRAVKMWIAFTVGDLIAWLLDGRGFLSIPPVGCGADQRAAGRALLRSGAARLGIQNHARGVVPGRNVLHDRISLFLLGRAPSRDAESARVCRRTSHRGRSHGRAADPAVAARLGR